ncbi:MAG: hypothetical protein K2G32_09845, partial [Oscillospiraceae bacterium]|nr:hypothetical protein [Oscillospiraceae bacterium]
MSGNTSAAGSRANETMVKVHICIVLGVCVAFGLVNIISGNIVLGIIIALAGGAVGGTLLMLKNSTTVTLRGTIMSQAQLIIIIVMSVAKHELHGMFPLMLASMTIAAIYYSKNNLIIHWVIMDTAALAGIIFRDFFYSGMELEFIIKGILGVNVGAAVILYLVRCSHKFIGEAEQSKNEANELVVKVREQVGESEKLVKQQNSVVERIALISQEVNRTSEHMLKISEEINRAAEEQEQTIREVSESIDEITGETENSQAESEKASVVALKSMELVKESNAEIHNMMSA